MGGVRSLGSVKEPGTVTQGAPVFPGSSRLAIDLKSPGWLDQAVERPNHQPIGDLEPTQAGSVRIH
jgi:hypothetical protein